MKYYPKYLVLVQYMRGANATFLKSSGVGTPSVYSMKAVLICFTIFLVQSEVSMKYLIFTIMMMSLSLNAMAELTQEQQRQIQQIMEKSSSKMIEPEDVEKWANLGSKIGVGLSATAKELGIAATEFAATSTGKVVTAIIIWQFLGSAVMKIITGLSFLFLGIPGIWFIVHKARRVEITYNAAEKNIFGNHPVKEIIKDEVDSDRMLVGMIVSCVVAFTGMVILVNV